MAYSGEFIYKIQDCHVLKNRGELLVDMADSSSIRLMKLTRSRKVAKGGEPDLFQLAAIVCLEAAKRWRRRPLFEERKGPGIKDKRPTSSLQSTLLPVTLLYKVKMDCQ